MSKLVRYLSVIGCCLCLVACGNSIATTKLEDITSTIVLSWEDETKFMFQSEQSLQMKITKQDYEEYQIVVNKLIGTQEEIINVTWNSKASDYVASLPFQDGESQGVRLDLIKDDVVVKSKISSRISIDSQAPQIQIFQNGNGEEAWQAYVHEQVSFRIIIKEDHFDETKTQVYRRDKGKADILLDTIWEQGETSLLLDDLLDTSLVVRSEDSYGNHSEVVSKPCSIDTIAPQIQVFENDKLFTDEKIVYHSMKMRFRIQEEHFDKEQTNLIINDQMTYIEWQDIGANQYEGTIVLNKSGAYTISLTTMDSAQLQNEWKTSFTIDVDAPQIQLYVDDQEIAGMELSSLYNEQVRLKAVVRDSNFNPLASKLLINQETYPGEWRYIDSSYVQEWVVQQEQTYDIQLIATDLGNHEAQMKIPTFGIDKTKPVVMASPPNTTYINQDVDYRIVIKEANFDDNSSQITYTYNGIEAHPQVVWEAVDDGYATTLHFHQDGLYRLQIEVRDKAGNEAVYQINQQALLPAFPDHFFIIDQSAGEMKTMFTQQNELQIYQQEQQMTIRIQEENFDSNAMLINIQKDGETYAVEPHWMHIGDLHSLQLTFHEDGEYHIKVDGHDKAGNNFKHSNEAFSFIIDQHKPVVSIEGLPTQRYTNQDVELQLFIEDINLSYGECFVLKDGNIYMRTPHFIYQNGTTVLTLPHEENGSYEVYIKAMDRAGNQTTSGTVSFVIDDQNPQVFATMNQVKIFDQQAFVTNQSSDFLVTWQDRNLQDVWVSINKNGIEEDIQIQNESSFHHLFKAQGAEEDMYTCTIKVTDKANNTFQQQFTLRVDTLLPSIQIANDIFQGKAKHAKWIAQLVGEGDEFAVIESSLYRNHKQILTYQWGDEISKDGVYNLSILIRDGAMNEARLLPSFRFVIDTQAPSIHIVDHQRLQEIDRQILPPGDIRIYDEEGSKAYGIYEMAINHERVSLSESEIDEFGNRFYLVNLKQEGTYTIMVKAIDEAGNESMREVSFQIKADAPPLQHIDQAQTPITSLVPEPTTSSSLFIISCISVVGAIVSAVVFYRFYGRKQ